MQTSNKPSLIPLPFADSGTKNTIPTAASPTPGLASLTTGFPPVTMTPIAAGGIPPTGADFNGILNLISAASRWAQAGCSYTYDSAFSTSIGGYPKGAILANATFTGFWINTTENNTTNPDTGGAGWQVFPMATGYMLVTQETASGVAAGGSTANTFVTRVLNTVRANTIVGASLASNQITLPAGTYRINASAPGNGVNLHTARVYNVTDAASAIVGTSENTSSYSSTPAETTQTRSFVSGRIVITATKVFELRHYCQEAVATNGLGSACSAGGSEVYSMFEIVKEA